MADAPANPTPDLTDVLTTDLLAALMERCAHAFFVGETDDGLRLFEWHGNARWVIGDVEVAKAQVFTDVLPKPTLDDVI